MPKRKRLQEEKEEKEEKEEEKKPEQEELECAPEGVIPTRGGIKKRKMLKERMKDADSKVLKRVKELQKEGFDIQVVSLKKLGVSKDKFLDAAKRLWNEQGLYKKETYAQLMNLRKEFK